MSGPGRHEHQDEKTKVAEVFSQVAPAFDRSGPPFFSVFGEKLARLAGLRAGLEVLDVGSGRGASAVPAARLVGPGGRVVCVDLAEKMVDQLRRDAHGLDLRNLDARVMDAEDLVFADASFDRVLGGFFLFFLPRPGRALEEMRRVLKPGGLLAVSTWDKRDATWQWLDDLTDSYLPAPAAARARARKRLDLTDTPEKMRALLAQADFEAIDIIEERREFTYSGEDEWWASLWTRGRRRAFDQIEAALGPTGQARFEAEARKQLRARGLVTRDGGVVQSASVLYSLASKPRG
jgi:ubiquinone/menaquinone biosynthesis C-methylase UbiE